MLINYRTLTLVSCLSLVAMLGGCATITGNSMQPITVEARDCHNRPIKDVQCKLSNDKGTWFAKAPDNVMVHKSASDLQIIAEKDGYDVGTARVVSKVGAGMFGNIIFGGGVGAIIDHSKGTAYNYPAQVVITMNEQAPAARKNRGQKDKAVIES